MTTTPRTIWRRRALAMALVAIAIAVPLTLLIRGDRDDAARGQSDAESALALNPRVNDSSLDAAYQVPEGWRQSKRSGVLRLREGEGSVQVGIASPGPADDAGEILAAALSELRRSYEPVEVTSRGRLEDEVGGLPARAATATARGDGVDLEVATFVAAGEKRSYLIQSFTAAAASELARAQTQRMLDSLSLRG